MELTMSMFANKADYWRARAELAERTVLETAKEMGCEPDNEAMLKRAAELMADKDRLDRLELYHREMDAWDRKQMAGKTMWVLFATDGVQGASRRIIDATLPPNAK